MRPETVAQNAFEDLAVAALGKFDFREFDTWRDLVAGQRPAAVSGQLVGTQAFPGLQCDARHYEFAPLWIRDAEDRCFTNRRMFVNDGFDFAAVNIFAARDDHVLEAVENEKIAHGTLLVDAARAEAPAVKPEVTFPGG